MGNWSIFDMTNARKQEESWIKFQRSSHSDLCSDGGISSNDGICYEQDCRSHWCLLCLILLWTRWNVLPGARILLPKVRNTYIENIKHFHITVEWAKRLLHGASLIRFLRGTVVGRRLCGRVDSRHVATPIRSRILPRSTHFPLRLLVARGLIRSTVERLDRAGSGKSILVLKIFLKIYL